MMDEWIGRLRRDIELGGDYLSGRKIKIQKYLMLARTA
jgi:hypothetical protein